MSTTAKNTGLTKLLPQFIKDLNRLQPEYSSADRIWQLHLRTGDKPKDWTMLCVTHYQETYYVGWTLCDLSLELDLQGRPRTPVVEKLAGKEARKLAYALKQLNRQVRRIKQDWATPAPLRQITLLAGNWLKRPRGDPGHIQSSGAARLTELNLGMNAQNTVFNSRTSI